jgi:hypothetical protein
MAHLFKSLPNHCFINSASCGCGMYSRLRVYGRDKTSNDHKNTILGACDARYSPRRQWQLELDSRDSGGILFYIKLCLKSLLWLVNCRM